MSLNWVKTAKDTLGRVNAPGSAALQPDRECIPAFFASQAPLLDLVGDGFDIAAINPEMGVHLIGSRKKAGVA